jgi:hypothetical protein
MPTMNVCLGFNPLTIFKDCSKLLCVGLLEFKLSASITRMSVGGSLFIMKFSVSDIMRLISDSCQSEASVRISAHYNKYNPNENISSKPTQLNSHIQYSAWMWHVHHC